MIGINWSGDRELPIVRSLLRTNHVGFVEVLIDNFLLCDPKTLVDFLGDNQCAFHIMNSQFLHKSQEDLSKMATRLKILIDECNPIYISDHIGLFYVDGLPTPRMFEIDYEQSYNHVKTNLHMWQEILNCKLYIENYASTLPGNGNSQPGFYSRLLNETGCGLLFDISNALVAESNTGTSMELWSDAIRDCTHFHVGGYEETTFIPKFLVDTHGSEISSIAIRYINRFLSNKPKFTLSVERDENIEYNSWLRDILRCSSVITPN